jgi:hypothetical protein
MRRSPRRLALAAALAALLSLAACGHVVVRAEGSPDDFDWMVGLPF